MGHVDTNPVPVDWGSEKLYMNLNKSNVPTSLESILERGSTPVDDKATHVLHGIIAQGFTYLLHLHIVLVEEL